MSDEEMKQLSQRLDEIDARSPAVKARAYAALDGLRQQQAEQQAREDALLAENAALREIVEAVAALEVEWIRDYDGGHFYRYLAEEADPIIAKARALLGKSAIRINWLKKQA